MAQKLSKKMAPHGFTEVKPKKTLAVSHVSDVSAVRETARETALSIGFPVTICEEIALVSSELATNLIKHAVEGIIGIAVVQNGADEGILLESTDNGPGIADVERAVTDGFSTSGSLGYGMGTVYRLMDDVKIDTKWPKPGTRIICRRLKPICRQTPALPLDIGAATRPCMGSKYNGDAFVIKSESASILAAVIDGLGHGQYAQQAAVKARAYIERHPSQPFEDLFRNVERECRTTRGVVMALARFNYRSTPNECAGEPGRIELMFAGIGNIEVRVMESRERLRFVTRRGIVGKNAPAPIVTRCDWEPGNIMVLHSDGLTTHWKWEQYRYVADMPSAAAARELLKHLSKDADDATILVVKWKKGNG